MCSPFGKSSNDEVAPLKSKTGPHRATGWRKPCPLHLQLLCCHEIYNLFPCLDNMETTLLPNGKHFFFNAVFVSPIVYSLQKPKFKPALGLYCYRRKGTTRIMIVINKGKENGAAILTPVVWISETYGIGIGKCRYGYQIVINELIQSSEPVKTKKKNNAR